MIVFSFLSVPGTKNKKLALCRQWHQQMPCPGNLTSDIELSSGIIIFVIVIII